MRCLSTFSGCGWAYGFTFTLLPQQTLPQIWESWLKSYLMQVSNPCHYILAEGAEPCKLYPMSISYIYEVFECLLRLWMGIWLHNHTITITDATPDLWELAEILPDARVQTMHLLFDWGCRTFQTASHVHVILNEVFEHLLRLWMGIWLHIHIVTTTDTYLDLWKLAKIQPFASVKTMQKNFGWGCRILPNAFHVHLIHIWGVWVPSQVVDGYMASHSHRYHHSCFPRFVRVG